MASRVAAQLSRDEGVEVQTEKGGLGEFSITIDGRKAVDTSRFWYPTPRKILAKARSVLAARPDDDTAK